MADPAGVHCSWPVIPAPCCWWLRSLGGSSAEEHERGWERKGSHGEGLHRAGLKAGAARAAAQLGSKAVISQFSEIWDLLDFFPDSL